MSKGYDTGTMESDIDDSKAKTYGTRDFEELDDITSLPKNLNYSPTNNNGSSPGQNKSLSKLEARLNSIRRGDSLNDGKEDSITRINRMKHDLKETQNDKIKIT